MSTAASAAALARTVRKDLLFFLRSRNAIILLLVVPLSVVLILGNVFNQKAASGVKVLVCSEDAELGAAYSQALGRGKLFSVETGSGPLCRDEGKARILSGKLSAEIFVPAGAARAIRENGSGQGIEVYYDNSQEDTASFIVTYISGITGVISANISEEFIGSAWRGLERMGEQIEVAGSQLSQVRGRLALVSGRMESARLQLENVSVSGFYSKMGDMESFLNEERATLLLANSSLTGVGERLSRANETLNDSRALLADADGLLAEDIKTTDLLLDATRLTEASFNSSYSILCSVSACPNASASVVTDLRMRLQGRRDKELEMRAKIATIDSNLTEMQAELANATAQVSEGRDYLARVSGQLGAASNLLSDMRGSLADFEAMRNNSISDLDYSRQAFGNISSEIESSLPKIEEARGALARIYSRDPAGIVTPVYLKPSAIFSAGGFSYVYPVLCAMVLMFNLLLLGANGMIAERKGGTLLRSYLARPFAALFVLSKLFALVVVGTFEALLMVGVAYLFYGTRLSSAMWFSLSALAVSVLFAAMGLAIGLLVKDESSALLVTVGVSIPSIFLSGGLLSFEFLPAAIKPVSQALPLSLSSQAMRASAVYGAQPDFLALSAYAAVLLLASIIFLPKRLE